MRGDIKETNDDDVARRVTEVQEMIRWRNRGRDRRNDSSDKLTTVTTSTAGSLERYLFVHLNECLARDD